MKRLFILSLLMMQGLWGAAAADMPVSVTVQTNDGEVLELVYDYLFFRTITNMVEALPTGDYLIPLDIYSSDIVTIIVSLCKQIRDNNGLLCQSPDWIGDPVILGNVIKGASFLNVMIDSERRDEGFAMFFTALYIAWLNANHTQPIIGRQTVKAACTVMGMKNPPAEWDQIFVDVSNHLRYDITSLHTRPGTIAHLVHTGQMPAVDTWGELNLENKSLTVCDAWNILNPNIKSLNLNYNKITVLAPNTFTGLSDLIRIKLSSNQIEYLIPGAFIGLDKLKYLFLDYNKIKALVPGVFVGLTNLINLYINDGLEFTLEGHPEWFAAPQAVAAQATPDDAICLECDGVGDACTCSADAAG